MDPFVLGMCGSDSDSFGEASDTSPLETMDIDSAADSINKVSIDKNLENGNSQNLGSNKKKERQLQILNVPDHLKLDGRVPMEIVASITQDGKITIGSSTAGMKPRKCRNGKSGTGKYYNGMRYNTNFIETFNGEPLVGSFKEISTKRREVLLLDKRVDLNGEVYHRSNPHRLGHVEEVNITVDVYLKQYNKIITNVPFNINTMYISINSGCWKNGVTVIWEKRKGRVCDCAYKCVLVDNKGRRVHLLISTSSSHHRVSPVKDSAYSQVHQAFAPGDKIKVVEVKEGLDVHWMTEEGILENEIFTIEEIKLQKVAILWEPTPKSMKNRRLGYGFHNKTDYDYDMLKDSATSTISLSFSPPPTADDLKDFLLQTSSDKTSSEPLAPESVILDGLATMHNFEEKIEKSKKITMSDLKKKSKAITVHKKKVKSDENEMLSLEPSTSEPKPKVAKVPSCTPGTSNMDALKIMEEDLKRVAEDLEEVNETLSKQSEAKAQELKDNLKSILQSFNNHVPYKPCPFPSMPSYSSLKRRREDETLSKAEWVEVAKLQQHSLIYQPTYLAGHTSRVQLTGRHQLISLEAYYNNIVIPEFEQATGKKVDRLKEMEMEEEVFFDLPVVADVINRHTCAKIHWFDGEGEENVRSIDLLRSKRLHHPTDVQVFRNMLLRRSRVPKNIKGMEREKYESSIPKEFGLVTKVSEGKMLTVKWFQKDGTNEEAKYQFISEEIISQYEHMKHHFYRIPLRSYVYFPSEGRNPDNIYDCVGVVESMSDDGYQTIRYFDGGTANFWPEEAHPIDGYYSGLGCYESYADYVDMEEESSLSSDIEEDSTDHLTSPSYSSFGSYPIGHASSHPFSFISHPFFDDNLGSTLDQLVSYPLTLSQTPTVTPVTSTVDKAAPVEKEKDPAPDPCLRRRNFYGSMAPVESSFMDSLKRDNKGYNTTEGIALIGAALVLVGFEKRETTWEETEYGPKLISYTKALEECEEFKDAYECIKLFHRKNKTQEEMEVMEAIYNKHENFKARITDLFISTDAGIAKVAGLIQDLYKDMAIPNQFSRLRTRNFDDTESSSIVLYPVQPTQEVKEFLDKRIQNPLDLNGHFGGRYKILLSYFCPLEYCPFSVTESHERRGVYIAYCSNNCFPGTFKEIANAYREKFETEKFVVLSGTLRNVKMFSEICSAVNRLMAGESDPRKPDDVPDDEFLFVTTQITKADDMQWKDIYTHMYAFSGKFDKLNQLREEEIKKDRLDRLDLDLEKLAEILKVDNRALFQNSVPNMLDPNTMLFNGEFCRDITAPHAIVLQVSPALQPSMVTDSFLIFHVLSQIVDSTTWSEIDIKIHKDCGNSSSLSNNFVVAWILLREAGILSGPQFNYAEAQFQAIKMKEECVLYQGQYVSRFGLPMVRQLRNILLKMSSLSCIGFWRRINLIEKHFGIERIIEAIKSIMEGGTANVIPFKDLAKVTEKCTDTELRNELATIQLNHSVVNSPHFIAQGTFKTLDSVTSHSYLSSPMREMRRDFVATIKKEHKLLKENIAEGVHVITYADRLDLLRTIIIGPVDTPYEGVPILFDIALGPSYPAEPPKVKYVSMTSQAINPNLYREGTVCLSLLGTWKGENPTMRWIPGTSNILQVVCSIQVEILMEANPYFNEPGFELRRNSSEGQLASTHYNGQVLVGSTEYFAEIMSNPPADFADFLREYVSTMPNYFRRMRAIMDRTQAPAFPVEINESVCHMVSRFLSRLETAVQNMEKNDTLTEKASDSEMTNLAEIFPVDCSHALTMFSSGNPGSETSDLNSFVILRHSNT